MAEGRLRVAGLQLSPVWLNKKATVEKIVRELETRCRGQGIDLVALSEALVPGYPFWIDSVRAAKHGVPMQMDLQAHTHREAVRIKDGDLLPIQDKARDLGLCVLLGVVEADEERGNALFCTSVFIGRDGGVENVHRKLMPTYDERKVWAIGDGHGLKPQQVGEFRVSTLNCWENWMPLARAALHGQGSHLHVALWPGSDVLTEDITRFIAREGRMYSLAVGGVLKAEDITEYVPWHQELKEALSDRSPWFPPESEWLTNGGSCIAGPNAQWIQEPILGGERMFVHDLDMKEIGKERLLMDVGGHYARPDVFQFSFNGERAKNVERK